MCTQAQHIKYDETQNTLIAISQSPTVVTAVTATVQSNTKQITLQTICSLDHGNGNNIKEMFHIGTFFRQYLFYGMCFHC